MRTSAMSVCLSAPITRAGYFFLRPGTLTITFSASSTTWWLVRMLPSSLAITPEPVTWLRRSLILTMASM
jgi:hypothetical protein